MTSSDADRNPPSSSTPRLTEDVPGQWERVALVADVHGNLGALTACLGQAVVQHVDAIAFLGCLTWGPEPAAVLELARSTRVPTFFLRGNGERAILELAAGERQVSSPTDEWMMAAHDPEALQFLESMPGMVTLDVGTVGRIRLCHGSPRSDLELLTPTTGELQIRSAFAGVTEKLVAHGHTHLQYVRTIGDTRIVGAGSVGLPYGAVEPGARWTILGPAVEPQCSPYDVRGVSDAIVRAGYPGASSYIDALLRPPDLAVITADAEDRQYSD